MLFARAVTVLEGFIYFLKSNLASLAGERERERVGTRGKFQAVSERKTDEG